MPRPSSKTKRKKAVSTPPAAFQSQHFQLLKAIFNDPVGRAWDQLGKWTASDSKDSLGLVAHYQNLWHEVSKLQEFARHPLVGNALQDHFLERFLDDPNPFHRKAELLPFAQLTPSLVEIYSVEVKLFLQGVLHVQWENQAARVYPSLGLSTPSLKDIRGLPSPPAPAPWLEERRKIKEKILHANSGEVIKAIADYFFRNGLGLFARHRAFRWETRPGMGGRLEGVEYFDPIRLENLVGYDEARKSLLDNIEGFVAGKGANNVLIYGERGTGKSSTVKALLNTYQGRGLRLVEVQASHLDEYHEILRAVRGRREKFILFVDDLSFEENETSYKGLKALLEGTVEATPSNVILIATSNRRHLVREFFSEREEGIRKDGEVHGQDTVEEKLSLSDRFGLVVSFYTPDQETYLRMVESWAKYEGIKIPSTELRSLALKWEKANNTRSGRTARQFINDLKGRI